MRYVLILVFPAALLLPGFGLVAKNLRSLAKAASLALPKEAAIAWSRTVALLTDDDLPLTIAFCLAGLLLALNVFFRFPDLGMVIEQFNQF